MVETVFKFKTLVVLVIIMGTSFSSLADAKTNEKDCNTCHTTMEHGELPVAEDACTTCHGSDQLSQRHDKKTKSGSTKKEPEPESTKTEQKNITKDGLLPGMIYPMYYDVSRLGDKPNEMVLIPAGDFTMGTNERLADEGPQHVESLPAYYIDIYEVTNLQYKKYIDDTNHRAPEHFKNRIFPSGKSDHPVTHVTWHDAKHYCEWAGKRLASDREWEKAARGTDGRTFPWGNEFKMHAANTPVRWSDLKQDGDTTPVGSFPDGVSPFGVYDMSGNVWEWTSTWYEAYPGNSRISENYGKKYRTLKGGSWWDCSFYKCGISAPVYNRSFFSPRVKNDTFGFRCAKDAR